MQTGRRLEFDWDDLRLFAAIARAPSLANAAKAVGHDTSTLSRRLKALEQALGLELVRRGLGERRLTEAGAALLAHALNAEREMETIARWAAGQKRVAGRVRVTAPEELVSGLLAPALPSLHAAHPALRVELIGAPELLDLARGQADVAVRMVRPKSAAFVARNAATLRYSVWCGNGYAVAPRGRHEWLILDPSVGDWPEIGWTAARLKGREPMLRATTFRALAAAAAAGLGVAILPDALAASYPQLRRLDPAAPPVGERRIWVVVAKDLRTQPRVRAVLDWIAETMDVLRAT
jgi:DNA-binding transcriptional LysR family regulator